MTIPQAFQIAVQHHRAGRLADAESLCRQILAVQPNHADALHFLGVIAHQVGRHDLAVESIRRAISVHPEGLHYYLDLGNALAAQGDLDEAIASYRRILRFKPDFPEALNNLGNALRERGQFDEAIALYRRALELRPGYPDAHNNLGNVLAGRGQLGEAIVAYRRALELQPDYPDAHNNLAVVLARQGKLDGAIAEYRRALQIKPDFPDAHLNLGNALRARGLLDEAVAAHCRAIQLKPDDPQAHNNLGNALRDQRRIDEAIAAYRQALRFKPAYPEAHNNLGTALAAQGQLDEAIAEYRRALELKPDNSQTYSNLGNALKDQGELDKGIAAFRLALQIKPGDAGVHSNLVYTLHFHPNDDNGSIAEEHKRWNRQFSEPAKQFIRPHANDRSPERRLRVGYVSPAFWDHVTGRYLVPLFERHDPRNFEIFCYSGVLQPDALTEKFRHLAHHWRNTVGASDEALAEMIRQDGVDILVDLTQHMAGNRLPMFARKPAPVQVSFAGYPNSAGLEAIEYRISDRYLEENRAEEGTGRAVAGLSEAGSVGFSGSTIEHGSGKERVCLIDSFWCYDPCGIEVEINGLPAMGGGGVTFGCLNNFCKVNERVLRLWAGVLGKVANSRLILLSGVGSHRQRTLEAFEREGIEARRVEFVEFCPRREYLELYHRVDIALDTAPCNGHTTSMDALWMGVPVVSLAGNTPVSRAGLSQLTNLGMSELVTHSEEDYVRIAVDLAGNRSRLVELRATLRGRMENSVLMDAPRFARKVEQAYREMWKVWCTGQSGDQRKSMSILQAFQIAVQHHRTGRLADAEALYRQILAVQPNHAEALHFLGAIANQLGRHDAAAELIRQSIGFNPNNPAAHASLGEASRAMGRLEEAAASYRRALELKPDHLLAQVNLGATLAAQGRLDEAIAAYRRAIEIQPDSLAAHNNLGNALREHGEFNEAIAACRRALELKPDFPEGEVNLGAALSAVGQHEEAIAAFRRALQIQPYYPEALNNLGAALVKQGRLDEAIGAYRRALELKADLPKTCNNLGIALRERGLIDEAISAFRRVIELKPGYAEAHNHLGNALRERDDLNEAITSYRRALEIKPDYAEAYLNLGGALRKLGPLDEAVAAIRRAIELKPDFPEAFNGLGGALKDRAELDEAIAAYRHALQIKPDYVVAHSNLVFALHLHPGYDRGAISEEQERWNRQFSNPLKPFVLPHTNDRNVERLLRIGYVSSDFRDHPVGRYLLPLLERHDRDRFEIICYSGTSPSDVLTERLRALAARWRNTLGIPDVRLAKMIREDGVDILVDLALHTSGNRLPVFARQPAPVQVTWLGYPGSTGLPNIGYRLTDSLMDPPGEGSPWSAEEPVRLPDCWCCYDPVDKSSEINALPALSGSGLTFGSLNNFAKISEGVMDLWARMMKAATGSRLVMLCPDGRTRERVRAFFEARGIATERMEFLSYLPWAEYLRLYERIDLGLDSFPYNGMTTTCDALWMGVPVLTLPGTMPASRAGLSLLSSIGLGKFAASSEEDYIRIAVGLAGDLPRLAELRATLRPRMQASPLMDAPRFARNVEAAYRSMWERWCVIPE